MSNSENGKNEIGSKSQTDEVYRMKMGDRAKVKLPDGTVRIFQLVWTEEIKPEEGLISNESPIGRALLGATTGEKRKYRIVTNTSDKTLELEVLEIYPKESLKDK